MTRRITGYELTIPADQDLEDIADYTILKFGWDQAVEYLTAIEDVFDLLVADPEMGRVRNDVRNGLRGIPVGEHIIFYRIFETKIVIVRVLHMSRDLPKSFNQE